MAVYNYSSDTSPTYGSLEDMIGKWGLSVSSPGENTFVFSGKTMPDDYDSIAVAIANRNGQQYYVEVLG